ncbi:hypothetical protein LEPN103867_07100 [Legionella pneumophila subsp. pneumophila]|nr:acetyltransferase [Legionella pneumophila]
MISIRQLRLGDESTLETFLKSHADESMFLRSISIIPGCLIMISLFMGIILLHLITPKRLAVY